MKKKLLLSLFIILLCLTVVMTAVACKKDPPTPNPGGKDPDPEPPVTTKTVKVETFVGDLVTGIDNVLNDLKDTTDKTYIDATIFFKFNATEGELRVAGTFDETVLANNKGLISVKFNGKDYVKLYTEGGVVYLGQTLLRGTEQLNWIKLSQAEGGNILQEYFAQVPALVKGGVASLYMKEGKNGPEPIAKNPIRNSEIGGYLGAVGFANKFFGITTPNLEYDLSKGKGGELTAVLKLNMLGQLLNALPNVIEGFDINELLESDTLKEYKGIIDTIVSVIFNGTLDQLIDGEIENYPEIKLITKLSDSGRLQGFSISYKNEYFGDNDETVEVAFGIKDLVVSTNTTANIAPEGAKQAAEGVIKLNVGINVPGKDINGYVEGFIFPNAELAMVDGELTIDLSKVAGYATAYLYNAQGQAVRQALTIDFNNRPYNTNLVRINLKDLYTIVGIEAPAGGHGYTYAFNLNEVFNNWFAPETTDGLEQAEGEASTNPIDRILAAIFSDDLDIVGLVTGSIGDLTAILDGVSSSFDAAINEAGRFVVMDLISAILENEVFAGSEALAEYLDYIKDEGTILANINELMSVEEIMAYVAEYTGFEGDEDDLLALEIDVFGINDADRGTGFGIGIYSGNTLVAEVSLSFDLVTGITDDPSWLGNFDGAPNGNLATDEGQDAILAALNAILDAYRAKSK